jgi:hypothetical protein
VRACVEGGHYLAAAVSLKMGEWCSMKMTRRSKHVAKVKHCICRITSNVRCPRI